MKPALACAISYLALALGGIRLFGATMGLGPAMRPLIYTLIPVTICGSFAALLVGPVMRAGLIKETWRRVLVFNVLGLSFVIAFYLWALTHLDGL
jgi:hypothetical protein